MNSIYKRNRKRYVFLQECNLPYCSFSHWVFIKSCARVRPYPPSSPDLNPLDNWILPVLKQKVYRIDIKSMEHLKSRIRTCWEETPQATINATLDCFPDRVSIMIKNEVRIENLMQLTYLTYSAYGFISICISTFQMVLSQVQIFVLSFSLC